MWPGIRSTSNCSLPAYLDAKHIQKHIGVHNLKSSWVLCANLYFPFREDMPMLAGFLQKCVSPLVEAVESVELEYESSDKGLQPHLLLGESGEGQRGANQTSPDVAFLVRTAGGKGLILTESKLVEHSFYSCSGRKASIQNPDSRRCLDVQRILSDLPGQCYQLHWATDDRPNRKYWDFIRVSDHGRKVLTRCPAATAGYQLFRQQALAEGIALSGKYNLVVSCVAYDERNSALIHCLRTTGINDFAAGWASLFEGKAQFTTFTHQQWVAWVRQHNHGHRWTAWLDYVAERYGY